jgi:glutamyl-tRNA synthetase
MDRRVRVRFAPSPTGPLHIGGVRTALYNYLFAKKHGGDFILRIEDTDQNRFVPGAEAYITEALEWIGLTFDEAPHVGGPYAPYRQSDRKEMYRQYAEQLLESGHAYYAFDTSEELEDVRKKAEQAKMSWKYDPITRQSMKNSLTLSHDEVQSRLDANEPYVVRIKLPRKDEIRFHDEIRGWVVVNTSQMDDKVLFKSDGMPTYHLANVVDDYLMKITHVIRGEEWLPSAPLHVLLYRYLGWEEVMPMFAHLPLLLKPEGNGKLSKRDGDRLGFPVFPLQWTDPVTKEVSSGYRETGYFKDAVVNMLALLGWHPSDNRELFTMSELVEAFTIEKVSKSGAKFDVEKAKWFNHHYLMTKPNEELADALQPTLDANNVTMPKDRVALVCGMMKEKVQFIPELYTAGKYFFSDPENYDEGVVSKKWKDFTSPILTDLKNALANLADFSATEVEKTFHHVVENEHAKKPGEMMQTFRLSLSGVGGGPPIFDMAAFLGKETVLRRIEHCLAAVQAAGSN